MTAIVRPDVLTTVAVDLYRDIHKGIRAELFALVGEAANIDPSDAVDRAALAAHVTSVSELLESHATHEDEYIQTALEAHVPSLADRVVQEHEAIEARFADLVARAAGLATSPAPRAELHWLHLDLATFTGDYLAHQDLEEREIMPALEQAIGPDAVLQIHGAIVGSIPPEELVRTLALMLPAMNVDDRTELLGGIRASAPAEVFDGLWDFTGSVLTPAQLDAVAVRLGR